MSIPGVDPRSGEKQTKKITCIRQMTNWNI